MWGQLLLGLDLLGTGELGLNGLRSISAGASPSH